MACCILLGGCSKPLPPMPLDVSFRPAVLGPGYVCMLQNLSDAPLTINVRFSWGAKWLWEGNRRGGLAWTTLREGTMTIPARTRREVGWMEGVALKQGTWVTAEHPDYQNGGGGIPYSFDY